MYNILSIDNIWRDLFILTSFRSSSNNHLPQTNSSTKNPISLIQSEPNTHRLFTPNLLKLTTCKEKPCFPHTSIENFNKKIGLIRRYFNKDFTDCMAMTGLPIRYKKSHCVVYFMLSLTRVYEVGLPECAVYASIAQFICNVRVISCLEW